MTGNTNMGRAPCISCAWAAMAHMAAACMAAAFRPKLKKIMKNKESPKDLPETADKINSELYTRDMEAKRCVEPFTTLGSNASALLHLMKYQKGEIAMNAVISNVAKAQVTNSAATVKMEQETAKSAEQTVGGQNTAAETSVSSKYDTLELSREYLKYKTQGENSALSDQTSQLNATVLKFAAQNHKEIVYNYQLYSYTETELLEMLFNGTISMEEYNNEMAGRDPGFEAENQNFLSTM